MALGFSIRKIAEDPVSGRSHGSSLCSRGVPVTEHFPISLSMPLWWTRLFAGNASIVAAPSLLQGFGLIANAPLVVGPSVANALVIAFSTYATVGSAAGTLVNTIVLLTMVFSATVGAVHLLSFKHSFSPGFSHPCPQRSRFPHLPVVSHPCPQRSRFPLSLCLRPMVGAATWRQGQTGIRRVHSISTGGRNILAITSAFFFASCC